jgi:hypothetical protein
MTIRLFSASTHRLVHWPIVLKFSAHITNNPRRQDIPNIFHTTKRHTYFLTRLYSQVTGPKPPTLRQWGKKSHGSFVTRLLLLLCLPVQRIHLLLHSSRQLILLIVMNSVSSNCFELADTRHSGQERNTTGEEWKPRSLSFPTSMGPLSADSVIMHRSCPSVQWESWGITSCTYLL